jgi:hypothetical protein
MHDVIQGMPHPPTSTTHTPRYREETSRRRINPEKGREAKGR